MNLNYYIEDICSSQCITKTTLACKLGITPTALSRWISGKSMPRMSHYNKLLELYNSSIISDEFDLQ